MLLKHQTDRRLTARSGICLTGHSYTRKCCSVTPSACWLQPTSGCRHPGSVLPELRSSSAQPCCCVFYIPQESPLCFPTQRWFFPDDRWWTLLFLPQSRSCLRWPDGYSRWPTGAGSRQLVVDSRLSVPVLRWLWSLMSGLPTANLHIWLQRFWVTISLPLRHVLQATGLYRHSTATWWCPSLCLCV